MPDQLTACNTLADNDDCMTVTVVGGCFDGVCLPRGCGNRVVEPEEQCDDGNQVAGDGCSVDCRSNETCGNGAVDLDEECDDGNLLSRDGCDSRCLVEEERIRIVGLSLNLATSELRPVYDPIRLRLVVPVDHGTWELVDRAWQYIPTRVPRLLVTAYDHDRQRVLGATLSNIYSWDGTAWTLIGNPGTGNIVAMGHDAANSRVLVWTTTSAPSQTFLASLAPDGTWTRLGTFIANGQINTAASVAFDPASKVVVLRSTLSTDSNRHQWVVTGNSWSQSIDPATAQIVNMFRVDGELRAIERSTLQNGPKAMFTRRDGTWVLMPQVPPAEAHGFPYHDLHDNAVLIHTGVRSFELGPSEWTERPALPSPLTSSAMADTTGFHVLDADTLDGSTTFRSIRIDPDRSPPVELVAHASSIVTRNTGVLTTSLGRGGAVIANGYAGNTLFDDTAVFDGSAWSTIENTMDLPGYSLSAYDPQNRRILTRVISDLWQLPDDESTWSFVTTTTGAYPTRMTWDARNGRLVGLSSASLIELANSEWVVAELYPQGIDYISSDERAGGILLVTSNEGDTQRGLWERRGDRFTKLAAFPTGIVLQNATYRSRDGMTMWYGVTIGTGKVAVFRDLVSATPLETCEPGSDADGDGLAFCDDPDCYWRCSRCPPYTTCRFDLAP